MEDTFSCSGRVKALGSEDGGELHREVAGLGTDGGGAQERKPRRGSPRSGSWAVEQRLSREGKHVWESEGSCYTERERPVITPKNSQAQDKNSQAAQTSCV